MLSEGAKRIAQMVRNKCICKVQWRPLAIIYATPYKLHEEGCYYSENYKGEV